MKFCLSSWSVLRAWFQDYWEYSLYSLPVRKCMYQHMSPLLFNCSVVSSSLQPHELQHTRLFYPSPSPGACWNSCPLSWWCHPTISSSVLPFPFCLQSFPASGSFLMSWLFTSGGQSIGALASASVLSGQLKRLVLRHKVTSSTILSNWAKLQENLSQVSSFIRGICYLNPVLFGLEKFHSSSTYQVSQINETMTGSISHSLGKQEALTFTTLFTPPVTGKIFAFLGYLWE